MVRSLTLSLLLLLPSAHARHQPAPADLELLLWNEFYKLQWTDFRGQPDENSLGDAGTAVKIKATPFLVRKEIRYDVEAFFDRQKSWVRAKSLSLLAHEQLHFDIAEWYARKIRKKIQELRARGVDDIKAYNSEIQELLQESNRVDIQYDAETLHGSLPRRQAEWSETVGKELAGLKAHKKPKRVIGG